jgi:hypothetical protein
MKSYGGFLYDIERYTIARMHANDEAIGKTTAARTAAKTDGQRESMGEKLRLQRMERHILYFSLHAIRQRKARWLKEQLAK